MPHDGLPARAETGVREADADRVVANHVTTTSHPMTTRRISALGAVAVALLVAACGSGGSSSAPSATAGGSAPTGSAAPSGEASPSASSGATQAFLTFQEQNASKVFGGGTIIDLGDGSSAVTLGIVAVGFTDPLPARLVSGACTDAASAPPPSFAPPPSAGASAAASAAASVEPSADASAGASLPAESTAPSPATLPIDLTAVEGGGSNTVVQIATGDLLSAPTSVLVYRSAADPTLVACSDVTPQLVIPSIAPGGLPSAVPSLPAGPSVEPSASTAP